MSARRHGFTLIEVMVAVAILALALSAIFSGEAGAAKASQRARKLGFATLAARCKMNEIEEQIAAEGLPAVFDSGGDECCKESPIPGVTCTWEIDPIVLPDTMFATDDDASKDPGAKDPKAAPPGATPGKPPPGGPGATDPMQALQNIDPQQVLAGGGLGGMAAMALSYAYPVLKPAFEAQIRRATVTVRWNEGSSEHSFDVTQYVVAERPTGVDPNQAQQQLQQQLGGGQTPAAPGTPAFGTQTQTTRTKASF